MQRISRNKPEPESRKDSRNRGHIQQKARPHAHLLPTLFDRLRDDAPLRKAEAPDEYAVSRQQMREIVQRDMAYLLNTANMEDLIDRDKFPQAAASAINFGVPALAGNYLPEHKWEKLEQMMRRAIADFEPRLEPGSLRITRLMKHEGTHHYNVLLFEIRGLIRMEPYPMEFMVQSSVDLETNRMTVVS